MKKQISGIYTIIDPQETDDIFNLCSRIAKTELNIIQYRDKKNDFETMLNIASKLKNICDKYNKIFIINDYPKLAKKINADGVHVGENDTSINICRNILSSNQIVGTSNNNISEIKKSIKKNVDYIAIGKIFPTSTMGKKDRNVVGIDILKQAKEITKIPIVGIGGINKTNVESVKNTGADAICIVSAITKAKNPEQVINNINNILNN